MTRLEGPCEVKAAAFHHMRDWYAERIRAEVQHRLALYGNCTARIHCDPVNPAYPLEWLDPRLRGE